MQRRTAAFATRVKLKLIKSWPLAPIIGLILTVATGVILLDFKVGAKLRTLSYDLLLVKRPVQLPPEAVIIYLDEISHQELNQSLNAPWDRALHAKLLDRLTAAGARAVAFDIFFGAANPDRAEADAKFLAAIKRNGRVIVAADEIPTGDKFKELKMPFDALREMVSDAHIGSAEMRPDSDMIVRSLPPNDGFVASLSWAAAELLKAPVTLRKGERLKNGWINYYRPANTTPSCRYYEALDPAIVPDSFFSNKTVFVGARIITKFAGERKDEYVTPHTFWMDDTEHLFISGVEIQATSFLNLLRGDWLERLPLPVERTLLIVIGILAGFGLMRLRPLVSTATAAGFLFVFCVVVYQVFLHKLIWFPWLIVVVQISLALILSIVVNSVQLYVQNKLFEKSLEMYLSPKLVKKFATNKDLLLPGAKKETLTILFSDIANFTSISEGMEGNDLCLRMNAYFQSAVSDCIHHTDGTIVKYIGDAIFAFWNAPDPQSDHAVRACAAALRFRDQPAQFMNSQQLITRIGLHTGEASVGNFGSTARVDYTALGENINLAARMEGLNKYLGTIVLITGDTRKEISESLVLRPLGKFRLKGFEKSVEVYELLDQPDKAARTQPLRDSFATALQLFHQREWDAAEAAFKHVLEISADDGPSKFYLKHLKEMHDHPPSANWSGEVELKEK